MKTMESNLLKVLMVLWFSLITAPNGHAEDTGLSKFWTDNYKAFHQIYGKTSDLDLYGKILPLSVTHGIEAVKFRKSDGLVSQHARYATPADSSAAGTEVDPFDVTENLAQLLAKRKRAKTDSKSPKSNKYGPAVFTADESLTEIGSPKIETDPATIAYFKQFEHLGTQQAIDFPQEGISGFKPYAGLTFRNAERQPQMLDSYRSIQDIIDASDNYDDAVFERQKANHELAHKAYRKVPKIQLDGLEKPSSIKSSKPGVRYAQGNDIFKRPARRNCSSSRCRKPQTQLRLRKVRPRLRNTQLVKHTIVTL